MPSIIPKLMIITIIFYIVGFSMSCRQQRYCRMYQDISVIISDTDTARVNEFTMDIGFAFFEIMCHKNAAFFSSAYALTLSETIITPERIEYVRIFSNQDYDGQHPAGTPLNDIFGMLETFEQETNTSGSRFDRYNSALSGKLSKAPDLIKTHQFKIEAKIAGTIIIMDTILNPIFIQ